MSLMIAFDVDGTLIDENDNPRQDLVQLAKILIEAGQDVIIWSGGGKWYAEMWRDRLGLQGAAAFPKTADIHPDIAIDDDGILPKAKMILLLGGSRNIPDLKWRKGEIDAS